MIRDATIGDLRSILEMGIEFHKESGAAKLFELDLKSLAVGIVSVIDNGICLIAEGKDGPVGMAAAAVFPWMFNSAVLTAQELWFWVKPEFRREGYGAALLSSLEEKAKAMGASSLSMLSLSRKGEKLFQSSGYQKLQLQWVKSL